MSSATFAQDKPKKKAKKDTVSVKADTASLNHIIEQQREILQKIRPNGAK